jgi:DNA excision repair protein ERCC-4
LARGSVPLVEDGFTVLHSLDVEDSAAWIVRLAKRARRGAPTKRADGPRRAPRHPSAQAEAMLSVVPGISAAMARSLLAAYGSLAAVAAVAPEGLRRHPGIGRVRAARLAEALHGGYVAVVDREPEAERPARRVRPARRWILTGPTPGAELQSFDRRAIALRALQSAADGTQLIDGLTGEVVAATT